MNAEHTAIQAPPATAEVSIIIPTLASALRREQLLRAVRSALAGSIRDVKVVVCVNGDRWDAGTLAVVGRMPRVEVHRLPEPSLPKAIAYGRRVVSTPLFGFLDDDDELLVGSIDARSHVLQSQPACDLVISNGIRRTAMGDEPMLTRLVAVPADPLRALFDENWLPSCGALFRTATVDQRYFDDYHDYAEWSWLAYCLAIEGKSVAILDEPTFVVNDSAESRSKSVAYRNSYLALYRRMLARCPPRSVRGIVRRRIASALHDLSNEHLLSGQLLAAVRLHVQCLVHPGGLRYASYSRHIVKAALMAYRAT